MRQKKQMGLTQNIMKRARHRSVILETDNPNYDIHTDNTENIMKRVRRRSV